MKKLEIGRYVDERPHRYHRQLMSVFVSAGLISAPGTPCDKLNWIDWICSRKEIPQRKLKRLGLSV